MELNRILFSSFSNSISCFSHKNGTVRATTARLLAQVVTRLGADRVLGAASPGAGPSSAVGLTREVRGRLLRTVAVLLTEGSLDARSVEISGHDFFFSIIYFVNECVSFTRDLKL
jgi:hypothetical protein